MKQKNEYKKASLGYGPWKEGAGQRLTTAAINEKVPVYVLWSPQNEACCVGPKTTPVPGIVLGRIITTRGTLPDHPRVSMKTIAWDGKLFMALNTGLLVVRESEFDLWYRREKAKGRWPSQLSRLKKSGRPSKRNEALINTIKVAMGEKISIAALRRRLLASGHSAVPSQDTLERLVDELYRETGDAIFLRNKRLRRKRS